MSAFALEKLAIQRPAPKPRENSLTMFSDLGMGIHEQDDRMTAGGAFADLAKLAISMVSTLPKDIMKEKIRNYKKHQVKSFTGGVQLEHTIYHHGVDMAGYFFEEMKDLGVDIVEVSDNYINLSLATRCKLIRQGVDHGLTMFAEAGDEAEETPLEKLIEDCQASLDAGAWKVLVEAAELMDKQTGELKVDYLHKMTQALGQDNLLFELPWVWLPNTHWHQTFNTLQQMIKVLGPTVNVGNLEATMLVYCEMIRNGSGCKLPKDKVL